MEALSLSILTEGHMWGNIAPWLKIEIEEFTIKTEVKTNFSYKEEKKRKWKLLVWSLGPQEKKMYSLSEVENVYFIK